MSGSKWFESLNLSKLDEDRYRILEYIVDKFGRDEIQELLGISCYIVWRPVNGPVRVNYGKFRVLLNLISMEELKEILGPRKLLESPGIVRHGGIVNYFIIMEILKLTASDEYLKQPIIKFVVDNLRREC